MSTFQVFYFIITDYRLPIFISQRQMAQNNQHLY